MYSHNFSMIPY